MKKAALALKYPNFTIQGEPLPSCTNCGGAGEFDMWSTPELLAPLVPCPCVCLTRERYTPPKALHAFTLVELLTVLAVLGIVFSIGYVNLSRWAATSALQQGVSTLSLELERSRTTAFRTSTMQPVTWTATSINGRPLDGGVTISTLPAAGLAYTAPYGDPAHYTCGWHQHAQRLDLRAGERPSPRLLVSGGRDRETDDGSHRKLLS